MSAATANGQAPSVTLDRLIDEITLGEPDGIGKHPVRIIIDGQLIRQTKVDIEDDCSRFIRDVCNRVGLSFDECHDEIHLALLRKAQTAEGTGPDYSQLIQPLSYGDFRDEFPNMRPPVIDSICRVGETVNLVAASKVGKSWMSMDLAMAAATGSRWLGSFKAEQGRVLLIDNELHKETLSSRMDHVRESRNVDPCDVECLELAALRGTLPDLFQIGRWLETVEPETYKLIVLDAWYRLLPKGVSENDNADMMRLYNELDRHADRLRCAFVVVHHASKGGQTDKAVTDVGAGAGSMSRAVDTHIVIRPHEQEGYAVMDAALRSFPPLEPQTIYFQHPLWHSSALEPVLASKTTAAERKRLEADREAFEAIAAKFGDEPFTAYDVRKTIGGGQQKADRIVRDGVKQGKFEQHGTTENQRGDEVDQFRATRTENTFETRTEGSGAYEW